MRTAALGSKSEVSLLTRNNDRLHLAIDAYILRLERERREGALLDHSIAQLEAQVQGKKELSQVARAAVSRKLRLEIEALERKQQLLVAHIGDLKTQNRTLRRQVDNVRMEQDGCRNIIARVTEEIEGNGARAELTSMLRRKSSKLASLQQHQALMLRSKSANDRVNFASRMHEMSEVIHKDSESKTNYLKQVQELFQEVLKRPVDHLDTTPVHSALLAKWTSKLQSKKHDFESYVKYIKELEDGFAQVRNATGIARIAEIVTAFIKSEEQQYALCMHVNDLAAEIDALEENLVRSRVIIGELGGGREGSQGNFMKLKEMVESKSKSLQNRVRNSRKAVKTLRKALDLAETPAGVLHELVLKVGFLLDLPVPQVKSPDFNLLQLTSEVEDWLETIISTQSEATSVQRSLEQLSPKRFDAFRPNVRTI